MRKHLFKNTRLTWLRFLLVTLLVLGVFFRLVNLDRKVYWYDEGFTSLRVGGYTIPEVVQHAFNGQVISITDFRRQYLSPNPEKGIIGTINSLAVEDPQHPPLYYLMTRFWMQWFGNSVAAIRSLPALISLLVFPCTYWLCLELFNSSLTGWIAITLIAVSPFHVVFAQEAREYSLWTVTILLSSATLLQAIRLKTKRSWAMYALTLALSLYSFLFSGFVAVGHGIYVIATQSFRLSKTVIAYLLASVVGLVAFIPWIWVVITHYPRLRDSTAWMTDTKMSLLHLASLWSLNISSIFFKYTKFDLILIPLILILVGYSIYFICCNTSKTVWLFILTLFGVTALGLIIPDLIYGGQRSLMSRFFIPCYLSIQLAVAYLLTTKINFKYIGTWRQKIWVFVMIVIISGGIISSAIISQSEVPWTKLKNAMDYKIARTINQAKNSLVIVSNYQNPYDVNASYLFSFSHLLDSQVKLQLVNDKSIPKISNEFSNIFLYNPCAVQASKQELEKKFKALLNGLEKEQYKVEPVKISQPVVLWRVEKYL